MIVRYRKSSGEVIYIGVALTGPSAGYDTDLFAELIDPATPNGTEWRDTSGRYRVLGYAKINDSGTVRNATQIEIDTFEPASTDDRNIRDASISLKYLKQDPKIRRIMTALIDILIEKEFNKNRTWFTNFQTEVAASTSLADFQTRMATLPAMPQRSLSQLRTQIENRISKDD